MQTNDEEGLGAVGPFDIAELIAYLDEHPDIREAADVMVSNAIAESTMKINQEEFGLPPQS
ncbi:hypothetical protein [Streptomyces sp. CB02460]|uniref:hypothetical protein n=1 Tax=Streptomyces sp. CB02460 TaxID=1703941 RepID=UPI0009616A46|nr:hypothetical protein AMK30_15545 [Streptomyces sp. CB02460]